MSGRNGAHCVELIVKRYAGSRPSRWLAVWLLALWIVACQPNPSSQQAGTVPAATTMLDLISESARSYVKLALAVGEYDKDYVDAYYGPSEWREAVQKDKPSLESVRREANRQIEHLHRLDSSSEEELIRLRHQYLLKQLRSMVARVEFLSGKKLSFDEEAARTYDVTPPSYPESHFQGLLDELESLLPGEGPVSQRYLDFKKAFVVAPDKLEAVFGAAIEEARRRTRRHMELPENESFVVEYVTDKSWSGYNWYKGNSHSLIQVNTDFPIYIDRAIDLACHEGYPGHHVYHLLIEDALVRRRDWVEFTVYPLFSPQSLIAEGSANFGIDVAFPGQERVRFERDVLFPLAGLDPTRAETYYRVAELAAKLNYAGNEAARYYLDGEIDGEEAARWLQRYSLMSPERSRQRVRFIEQYRSYVINYNLGQDLVRSYIEARGGTADNSEVRWEEFKKLLSSPRLPSGLK